MTPRSPIALAVALTALAAAGPAAAQAAWTAPQAIVSQTGAANVAGVGNRHGSEAFTWVVESKRAVSAAGQRGLASWVRARIRLPDGHLGAVQTISSTRGLVRSPQIGVDENANVTAVWVQAARHLSIMAAFRPHGKRFGAPVELGRSRHFNDARPQLAVGRFGDAVVAWNHGSSVQVVRRGVASCTGRHCFTAPLSLRKGTDQAVAIGPLGSAYVVWAAFGPQALVSPPGVAAGGASLAVDPAGAAYLLYGADGGTGGRLAIAHVRAPGAIFGAPMTLPNAFADGTLLASGPRITAVSRFSTRTFVSDWTP